MAGSWRWWRVTGSGVAAMAALAVWVSPGLAAATSLSGSPSAHAAPHRPARRPANVVKYYVVRPLFNGKQEFLYEIAQRLLGNGDLYPEIFDLNKGRLQPDGGRLTNPTQIDVGWILQLPQSAHGPGVLVGPLPVVKPVSPASPTAVPGRAAAGAPNAKAAQGSGGGGAGLLVIAVIVLAAVVVQAAVILVLRLRARRRARGSVLLESVTRRAKPALAAPPPEVADTTVGPEPPALEPEPLNRAPWWAMPSGAQESGPAAAAPATGA